MFKIRFYKNIAQNSLFITKTNAPNCLKHIQSVSSDSLPEKFLQDDKFNTKRPHFNYKDKVHHNSWNNATSSACSEQQFLVKAKNNPDLFGDCSVGPDLVDEGDVLEEKYFTEQPSRSNKLSTKQYADIIKSFIRQRKIKEAIDVVEVRMIKHDRVKPENYIYNLLLGACGRVGYTKKAFMLYNNMKKRALKVTGGTYTALFNACANSPWPQTDGLTRANHLYNIMIEKNDQPNETTYNAMIKAFGKCGDLSKAFSLVDEMVSNGFHIKDDTMNFLLQACITDKESGFRHALLVWRKLIEKNIRPSIFTFNLLLRCVRDCELGDLESTEDVIDKLLGSDGSHLKALPSTTPRLALQGGVGDDNQENSVMKRMELRPNLLAQKPHLGNILSLSEVKMPEDRLLLVGGCQGFLETMSNHKCTPDIKTFTQLLDCIPSTLAAEKDLIVAMKRANIVPDIDFYNMLIKKKSMRSDYEGAKEVLISMKQNKKRPDLITYGVLALACKNKEEALELVGQLKRAGYAPNAAILGAMLKQACYHQQFSYIFEVMELCLRESVSVNKKFLDHLKAFKEKMKVQLYGTGLNKTQEKQFEIFKARYKTWLSEVQIDESEDAHPWQQYRQTYPDDVIFKPKDTARFKARHTSLFKVRTSTKQRY